MKFEMGRAWNDAVALLRANRQVVLVLAGVFFFLPYLALIIFMPDYMQSLGASGTGQPADAGAIFTQLNRVYSEIWWALLIMAVVQGIGMLGMLALLSDSKRPTVGEALAIGAKCFLPYIGAQILQSIAIVLVILIPFAVGGAAGTGAGLLVGLIAAPVVAYLFTKFSLTIPVIVIDGVMNPVTALSRSWSLTKGNSLRLFGFYVLLFIALMVISIVLAIVFGIIGALTGPDASLFIGGLSNALINMIAIAFFLAVLAAVHRQLSGTSSATVSATFE